MSRVLQPGPWLIGDLRAPRGGVRICVVAGASCVDNYSYTHSCIFISATPGASGLHGHAAHLKWWGGVTSYKSL